jgi:hypothetical protein
VELQLYEPEMTWGLFEVPVIALFTKFDQFKRDIAIELEDKGHDPGTDLVDAKVESVFTQHYLANFAKDPHPPFIRLESEDWC